MYKSHEIIGVILFGLALGLVMFAGLALDDKAEQLEQATWHRFSEIDNAIR